MEAAQDENILNCFIEQQETVILCTASRVTGHFVTKSDDEWTIALSAFVEAVKAYDLKRGSFFNFAKMVIQRRLIDYIRQQKKYRNEITVNPVLFDSDSASMKMITLDMLLLKNHWSLINRKVLHLKSMR